ncbi:MAG: AAA family ATPase [Methylococcales bacterium]
MATALQHGLTEKRRQRLIEVLDSAAQTILRWRRFGREVFPQSRCWLAKRGRLMPPLDTRYLPAALRERCIAHLEGTLLRPVLLIDEAQEMQPSVLNELRLLSNQPCASRILLTVILAGDARWTAKLRRDDLLPLGSRIRTRPILEYANREELTTCLKPLQTQAGNPGLMTTELVNTLCEHALGNYRVLATRPSQLLAAAAQQELPQLDEKLFLNLFGATVSTPSKRLASSLTIQSPNAPQPGPIPVTGPFASRSRLGPVRLPQRTGRCRSETL